MYVKFNQSIAQQRINSARHFAVGNHRCYIMSYSPDSDLLQLLKLIDTSTRAVEKAYEEAGIPHPSACDGKTPFAPHIAFQPAVTQTTQILVAACKQLIASVTPPPFFAKDFSFGVRNLSSLAKDVSNAPLRGTVLRLFESPLKRTSQRPSGKQEMKAYTSTTLPNTPELIPKNLVCLFL